MLKPLRTSAAFIALTLMLVGWLNAWTLPTQSMWWTLGNTHPQWLELRQFRPLYWIACKLSKTEGRGNLSFPPGDSFYTGPVVIRTDAGIRVVRAEALSVILESELVRAAAYEQRSVSINEYGLLAVSAVRQHTVPEAMSVAGLPPLSLEDVQAALYPETLPTGPRTRWSYSSRAIIQDLLVLLASSTWIYSALGILRWRLWKRNPSEPPA